MSTRHRRPLLASLLAAFVASNQHLGLLIVGDRYRVKRKIGSGSFGDVYLGVNIQTSEEVAIKLEPITANHPQLASEHYCYQQLSTSVHTPHIHLFTIQHGYNCLVMEHLGASLEALFNYCARRFTLKTVLMLSEMMIASIQYVHSRNFLHRDVKPDNYLVGIKENSARLYLVDFGLAKAWTNTYREGKHLIGTARYASTNTHRGIEQSRRDDLESLGYVWMYFLRGSLPWQGLKAVNRQQRYDKIAEKKMATSIDELCAGFPHQFADYIKYCRALGFDELPDYAFWRCSFRYLFLSLKFSHDNIYDWTLLRQSATRAKISPLEPLPPSLQVEKPSTSGFR